MPAVAAERDGGSMAADMADSGSGDRAWGLGQCLGGWLRLLLELACGGVDGGSVWAGVAGYFFLAVVVGQGCTLCTLVAAVDGVKVDRSTTAGSKAGL